MLYLVVSFTGERYWLTASIARVPQPLGLPVVVMLVWALASRRRRIVWLNILVAVFYAFTLLGVNVPLHRGRSQSSDSIRVMSFNVRQGAFGAQQLARVISEQAPDILCLQEVDPLDKWGDPLPDLKKLLPGGWHLARCGDVATLSRYPIVRHEVHHLPANTERTVLQTVIDVKGEHVTVLNTHFNVASIPRLKTRSKEPVPELMGHTACVLSEQMCALVDIAQSSEAPVIIAGDLNLPPLGPTYRRAARLYQDAFRAAGWGLGYTSRPDRPLFRIDYIFVDKVAKVDSCFMPTEMVSDHRPVVADVTFPH